MICYLHFTQEIYIRFYGMQADHDKQHNNNKLVWYDKFIVFVYNLIRLGSATDKIENLITVELMACKKTVSR